MTTYRIDVKTGRRFYADTRSRVSIKLFDRYNHVSDSIPLVPNRPEHAFWGNHTESFEVDIKGLSGSIAAVELNKDNSGRQPAWFLERVEKSCPLLPLDGSPKVGAKGSR